LDVLKVLANEQALVALDARCGRKLTSRAASDNFRRALNTRDS
jgi:hypothetical protein